MFESVFYTVAPMIVLGVVAVPAALALSVCAGVHKYAAWREYKASLEAGGDASSEAEGAVE